MQARMNHPAIVIPEAMRALHALSAAAGPDAIPQQTIDLVQLRASQINGCSACVDVHAKAMKKGGETDERLFAVAAWREATYFTDAERAALALSECVTRLSDRPGPRCPTRSGPKPPATMTKRRWRHCSSGSPRSTSGTVSTSPSANRSPLERPD